MTKPTDARPREVWERSHEYVRAYDLDAFASMFAENGVLELPFAPAGMPQRLNGREEIRRFLAPAGEAAMKSGRRIVGYSDLVVHETTDAETLVVEFTLNGEMRATGETYQLRYIQVVRVRDGQIVFMRDYMDPRVFARM